MEAVLERDYFRHVTFTHDLLSYCMRELGTPWCMSDLEIMEDYRSNKRFQPQVGDAVLRYQRRHARQIVREINALHACGPMADILLTIAAETFREENFVREFFKFCAQIVTMGVEFMQREQSWQIDLIVSQMESVYVVFLKQRFMGIGGWNVLERYAVRYCVYEE